MGTATSVASPGVAASPSATPKSVTGVVSSTTATARTASTARPATATAAAAGGDGNGNVAVVSRKGTTTAAAVAKPVVIVRSVSTEIETNVEQTGDPVCSSVSFSFCNFLLFF